MVVGSRRVALVLVGALAIMSGAAATAAPRGDGNGFGFELGNGSRVFTNTEGNYRMVVNSGWDVKERGQITEILSPTEANEVGASLKISVAKTDDVQNFTDLVRRFTNRAGWSLGKIGKYHSVQREAQLKEDRCMFEARIFKSAGQVTMISVDGGPNCKEGSDFDRVKSQLSTFTLLE